MTHVTWIAATASVALLIAPAVAFGWSHYVVFRESQCPRRIPRQFCYQCLTFEGVDLFFRLSQLETRGRCDLFFRPRLRK
jgi:hypothetical protein